MIGTKAVRGRKGEQVNGCALHFRYGDEAGKEIQIS